MKSLLWLLWWFSHSTEQLTKAKNVTPFFFLGTYCEVLASRKAFISCRTKEVVVA